METIKVRVRVLHVCFVRVGTVGSRVQGNWSEENKEQAERSSWMTLISSDIQTQTEGFAFADRFDAC